MSLSESGGACCWDSCAKKGLPCCRRLRRLRRHRYHRHRCCFCCAAAAAAAAAAELLLCCCCAAAVLLLLSHTYIRVPLLRVRAVLIEQLFPNFSPLFFQQKLLTGKAGKTGNISKVWKFNRGKNIWKASYSNIRKKKSGNLDKKSFDKNGPYIIRYTLSNYQV